MPGKNPPTEKPGRSTGPLSETGKSTSSMNRLTHGCCSEKHVLPHEDPEEFAATIQFWFDEYLRDERENYDIAAMLVQETALAQWHFTRNRRRLEEFESKLPASACDWTGEHHKEFQNFNSLQSHRRARFPPLVQPLGKRI